MAVKRQETLKNVEAVHRSHLARLLQHRIEAARSCGDDRLLHTLEEEFRILSR